MSNYEKEQIIDQIMELLIKLTESTDTQTSTKHTELLSIKECTKAVCGVSEHTIRQLVAQGKIRAVRTGEGRRSKILVNKSDLMNYFN